MVGVFKNDKQVLELGLGLGLSTVSSFYNKVVSEIKDPISINRSFGYNIDVTIAGEDLTKFIDMEYPIKAEAA